MPEIPFWIQVVGGIIVLFLLIGLVGDAITEFMKEIKNIVADRRKIIWGGFVFEKTGIIVTVNCICKKGFSAPVTSNRFIECPSCKRIFSMDTNIRLEQISFYPKYPPIKGTLS